MAFSAEDHVFMADALRLAEKGLYTTDPNPRVGCVIVKDGRPVGRGFHRRAGEAHAELNALREAGEQARGAIAYVTLEPCAHFGRTPPCTGALIAAGIKRVVGAMQDPNPQVAGKGFAQLRAAGIEIASGLLETEARQLNPGFISRMVRRRPWVRTKLAVSLDGRTTPGAGQSRWISGEAAREDAHRWRARSSAILTGIGTVLADDPSLTVRLGALGEIARPPLRVVVDSKLRTPVTAKLLAGPAATCIVTLEVDGQRHQAFAPAGTRLIVGAAADGRVDLTALMSRLAEMECNEILVEAGATLNGALLKAGLLDEVLLYVAPCVIGDSACGMFNLPGPAGVGERRMLRLVDVRSVGPDMRILAIPMPGDP